MGARLLRVLLGDRPRALLLFLLPTALAVVLDVILRAPSIAAFAPQGKAIYASSLLVSAAFWMLPSWVLGRLWTMRARVAVALLLTVWILPFATLSYAGQALYHRVFFAYMGRDTLRLGIALRGTVRDWFAAWGGPWLLAAMLAAGVAVTLGILWLARRARVCGAVPVLPVLTFAGAMICFWTDNVDSRFLQAATPDACFVHAVVHALRVAITGHGELHQGMSMRSPLPLPPLQGARARSPNVIVILTESLRADVVCSDPPPRCRAPFFDAVAGDRVPLGKLTSQTPNTFSACMVLWTGLAPDVDFTAAHQAPVLWELARAVGYRTAYVTSQNPRYEDFGTFVRRAGIDLLITATELGGMGQEQIGAPDERATAEMLAFVRSVPRDTPYFGVLHLSNTHSPYRTDPGLLPFLPESEDPLGDVGAFKNHYRNAAELEERTLSAFIAALRASPRWDDTVVLFLSDHGEQFREHGGLYHNHSLYDEELRVPGWITGGARALDDAERASLLSYAGRRTYMQDVHETVVDLFGLEEARTTLPLAKLVTGRSLVRPPPPAEPVALLATSTGVWEPDDARFGVMQGERVVVGAPSGSWTCFDLARDPGERSPTTEPTCAPLVEKARGVFRGKGVKP